MEVLLAEESSRSSVSPEESKKIYDKLGYDFCPKQFHIGMNVELEHNDVTDGDLIKTAKIAAAHIREVPDYYTLLKKYVEKKKTVDEDGGVGISLPGGVINGAPKSKDVRKMRKTLDLEK